MERWQRVLVRAMIVSGLGILVGFILYRDSVFIPTMRAFQFTHSSVTAGLTYAFLKGPAPSKLWVPLLCWLIVVTLFLEDFNWWLPNLNTAYIAGIAAAVSLSNALADKPFVHRPIHRIALAASIIAIANGIIIVVLGFFSSRAVGYHFPVWIDAIKFNMGIGAVIGLAVGIGIELAEFALKKWDEGGLKVEDLQKSR